MEPVNFESARDKEVERSRLREGRHRLLDKVKGDFEKRQRRDKERREQEKWMLPSLNERLSERKTSTSKKKKKKDRSSSKQKHKSSKDKKCKKSKSNRLSNSGSDSKDKSDSGSSSSSEDSESDAEQWVEKKTTTTSTPNTSSTDSTQAEKLQRDSWMIMSTTSGYVPTLNRDDLLGSRSKGTLLEEKEKRRMQQLEKPGQYERELNPYWKDGGSGVPESEDLDRRKTETTPAMAAAVGDAGLKWLERAYRRAREQAAEENRPLEEVAAERWGSLEKLESMLNEARLKDRKNRGDEDRGSRRHGFRRPAEANSEEESGRRRRGDRGSPSRDVKRPSFLKPDSEGVHREGRSSSASRCQEVKSSALVSTSTSHPRWKKKEFVKTTTATSDIVNGLESSLQLNKIVDKVVEPSKCISNSRDSSLMTDIERPDTPPPRLTDKQMNDLGAKIIKAELLGNNALAAKLRSQLEFAKEVKSQAAPEQEEEQVVILKSRRETESSGAGASGVRLVKKQRVETHDADGQRARYFADDDKYSLKQMFEREKMGTAEDQNAMFARLIGKGADKTSEEYDMDDMLTTRASRHVSDEMVDEQMRQRMLQEHRTSNAAMDNCRMCLEGKETPKHLIIAIGIKTYLTLPAFKSLTSGHCLIVPAQHVSASTYMDEDVWSEMQIFRKGLTRMFEDRQQDVVFFETSLNLKRCPHMVIQCVPLPKDVGNLAPMYFKKAILESEMEWSNNKKIVDLSQKNVRRAVPKGLPYFTVDFGLQGGFAHVVEDEQLFPRNFAQEIIGGLLDLDPMAWRRPPRETFDDQRKKVLEFADWWKPYDWTRRLKADDDG